MPNPPLGDELSERRGERGWTQRDLARRLDASVSAVSAWENNRYTPNEEIATALVDLFGESNRDLSTHERRERDR